MTSFEFTIPSINTDALRSSMASQRDAMCAQVSFAARHQSYYSDLDLNLNRCTIVELIRVKSFKK